jgi:hypothetical protein
VREFVDVSVTLGPRSLAWFLVGGFKSGLSCEARDDDEDGDDDDDDDDNGGGGNDGDDDDGLACPFTLFSG